MSQEIIQNEPKEQTSNSNVAHFEQKATKALRAHKKVDYFEEFSDGDQEEYEEAEEKRQIRNPPRRKKRERSSNKENKKVNYTISDRDDSKHSNYGFIIDLNSLKDSKEIKNSDLILILLEICLNSPKYGIDSDNSSRNFWDKLSQREDLFHYLNQFKPETLRKYWRKLRTTYKYKKLISAIKEFADKLNEENMKLLSSINAISDYVINPSKGIDHFVKKYSIKQPIHKPHENEVLYEKSETENEEEDGNVNPEKAINDIVESLKRIFPEKEKEEIYNKLLAVNGNVEQAYLYIKDEEHFSFFAFNAEEDNLILNSNANEEKYKELIMLKGNDNIKIRKEFLLGEYKV